MKIEKISESGVKDLIVKIYREEQLRLVEERLNSLKYRDRVFSIELYKAMYPENSKLIKEAKWYNTVGDIAGIFDPTGLIDITNGVSYWNQGDKLFAVLSWVSAIPYLGDLIAKPVVGVMKLSSGTMKSFKAVANAGSASGIAKAAQKAGGVVSKFVTKASEWGPKLINFLESIASKVPALGGLIKLIKEYVDIFKVAGKELKAGSSTKAFRSYKGATQSFKHKYIVGGMFRLFGNRATRSLMRRTKWYLSLLDFLGVANFVGPEELMNQVPDLESKVNEYSKTPESKKVWEEEFGSDNVEAPQETVPQQPVQQAPQNDGFSNLIDSLLGAALRSAI